MFELSSVYGAHCDGGKHMYSVIVDLPFVSKSQRVVNRDPVNPSFYQLFVTQERCSHYALETPLYI